LALAALNQAASAAAPLFAALGVISSEAALVLPVKPLDRWPSRRGRLSSAWQDRRHGVPAVIHVETTPVPACAPARIPAPAVIAAVPWFAFPALFAGDARCSRRDRPRAQMRVADRQSISGWRATGRSATIYRLPGRTMRGVDKRAAGDPRAPCWSGGAAHVRLAERAVDCDAGGSADVRCPNFEHGARRDRCAGAGDLLVGAGELTGHRNPGCNLVLAGDRTIGLPLRSRPPQRTPGRGRRPNPR
jgi:hypothetical protein